MNAMKKTAAALFGASMLALLGGAALAGSVVSTETAAKDHFNGSLQQSLDAAKAALAEATRRDRAKASGGSLFYDPAQGSFSSEEGVNDTDVAWAQSNLAVLELLRQFGVDANRRALSFRREGSRYYVGAEGLGGAWFTAAGRAQSYLFRTLLADSEDAPEEAVDAVTRNRGSHASLQQTANVAAKAVQAAKAFVALGGETKVRFNSKKVAAAGTPSIVGPPGIVVLDVKREGAETLLATVRTDPSIGVGPQTLYAYDEGRSYKRSDSFEVFVTGSGQAMTQMADQVGATTADAGVLTPGTPIKGAIETARDEDLYRIDLAGAGRLTLVSGGPTDILLKLEDENGQVKASDDDGGVWYQARLSTDLAAGTYFVRVGHCCRGVGPYTLSATVGGN